MNKSSERIASLTPEKRRLLEHLLRERSTTARTSDAPGIRQRPEGSPLILSHAQLRMWYLSRFEPDSPAYHVSSAVRLRGPLRVEALEAALGAIVERHEVLRTAVFDGPDGPRAVVAPGVRLVVEHVEIGEVPDVIAEVERLAERRSTLPFDLRDPPPCRVTLFRLGSEDHVLLMVFHHLAFDGSSVGILLDEFAAAYVSLSRDRGIALTPRSIQYGDYALWEREVLAGPRFEVLRRYWEARLAGAAPMLTFPGCCPAVAGRSRTTGGLQIEVAEPAYQELTAFCAGQALTPFIVLLAAFKIMLRPYCATDDLVVGTQSVNRIRQEVERLIGLFVNPLAIRTDLSGGPSFLEACRRVRDSVVGAFAHQELPFDQVVRTARAGAQVGRHPVFNVVFNLRNQSMEARRIGDLTLEPLPDGGERGFTPKFDLVLHLVDTGRKLGGAIEYDPALFDDSTIRGMRTSYLHLIDAIVSRPGSRVRDVGLIPQELHRNVLKDWNGPVAPVETSRLFHQLFEAACDLGPGRPAVSLGGTTQTYGELEQKANRLARHLQRLGLGHERVAAIYLDRSPDLVVSILASLKAGGAFVLLDPRYPSERHARILEDSDPIVIITVARLSCALPATATPQLLLDLDASEIARESDRRPANGSLPDHPAYLIYTSGSTGAPKGVIGIHRGLSNLAEAQVDVFGLGPKDRILQFASPTFDAFLWELVLAWRSGAVLVLADWEDLLPGPALVNLLRRERVTMLTIPPSVLAAVPPADLPDLRTLVVAGEACPAGLVGLWSQGRRMVNAYGPTEVTIWASYGEAVDKAEPPIGQPILNLRVYVLDEDLAPLPHGCVGELFIAGEGLTRGYLDRPDLTAEHFLPDPFASQPGGRMYRTGDVGSHRTDGQLRFLGRVDDQVKIRGFRVEPGEVAAILATHPRAGQVHVAVREARQGQQALVAWYVPKAREAAPEAPDLRAWADRRLPSYMRPSAYVRLEEMPLTAHGKIDRRRLPEPDWGAAAAVDTHADPIGPIEMSLARTWSDVLGIERVGRHDDFFALGGDSILSIRIVAQAAQAGIAVQVRQIFEHPTIARLAVQVQPTSPPAAASPARDDPYRLSPTQEGMLYHSISEPESSPYVQQFNATIRGALDREAFRIAWQKVLDRHSSLRTSFAWDHAAPTQRVHSTLDIPFQYEDWRGLAPDDQTRRWTEYRIDDLRRGFALDHPPLLRLALFHIEKDTHYFTWTSHHILFDGWSYALICEEVLAFYVASVRGVPSALPTAPAFREFIDWLELFRQQGTSDEYWERTLGGFEEPLRLEGHLPASPRGGDALAAVDQETVTLSSSLVSNLQVFCRDRRLTVNTVVQAAWALLLSRYSGRQDVLFGVTLSGRPGELPGIERTVGLFINTLPFRVAVAPGVTIVAWLKEVQCGLQELSQHAGDSLVEIRHHTRLPGGESLFDIVVAFQNYPGLVGKGDDPAGLLFDVEPVLERTGYPLTVLVEPGDPWRVRLIYDRRRLPSDAVAQMGEHLRFSLEALPGIADRTVADWTMLSPDTHRRMTRDWNETGREYPGDRLIPDLFTAQARLSPGKVAVVFEGESLSYEELSRGVNRLARWLQTKKVGPESIVAVIAERSFELVTALLAVLKAGGAYLPLPVEGPPDRLSLLLEESRPALILTQRSLLGMIPATSTPVVSLDDDSSPWRDADASDLVASIHPGNAAYVIYTSGSTGKPKGVVNTHEGFLNRILWFQDACPIGPGDRIVQKTPYTFDISVWEFFWPLITGATLVVARPGGHRDSEYLADLIEREWITVLHFVPSMLQCFLEEPDVSLRCGSLRLVICSGEALAPSLRDRFFESIPAASLLNLYGPTEAAIDVTHWWCRRGDVDPVVPIGRPIANIRTYIVDHVGDPVPAGVAGELRLGGVGLARGYIGRPDLTAERFVPDPFSPEPGALQYRTGDLARYRGDGTIEFLGRLDHQVKIRGQRVELGEVEENLRGYPGVRDAVVVCRKSHAGEPELVGHIAGDGFDLRLIREFLAARLPDYMVPSRLVAMQSLPLNPNGKVDRQALPLPESTGNPRRFVPPGNALEREVAGAWAALLKVGPVGGRDHFFFDLGGNSLLALRLLGALRSRWGRRISLADFLRDPTVEAVAGLLRRESGNAPMPASTTLVPIQPQRSGTRPPLFLAPPALGVALCFYELARSLGPEQPVYAFESPGYDGQSATVSEIPALASKHLAALRDVRPDGPVHLAGYSFGGILAFEMARQIALEGREVASLTILDTLAPEDPTGEVIPVDESLLIEEIAVVLERYQGLVPDARLSRPTRRDSRDRLGEVKARLEARGALEMGGGVVRLEGLLAASLAAIEARSRYTPGSYEGAINLIRCADPSPEDVARTPPSLLNDPSMGWNRWSGRTVEVCWVPGDHLSLMMPPTVSKVAEALARFMAGAPADRP